MQSSDFTWTIKMLQKIGGKIPHKSYIFPTILVGCLLTIVRIITGFFSALAPFEHPHIWRQIDTLGVTFRYWNRWSVEASSQLPWFIPTVLNSGDRLGSMPMEFPILNILIAPSFALGHHTGMWISRISLLMVHILLWGGALYCWKGKKIAGQNASQAFFLIPAIGLGQLYFTKFIPDFSANCLALIALGLSWNTSKYLRSFILSSLALLSKPTAGITLFLLLLHPGSNKDIYRILKWMVPAIAIGVFYYTFGIKYIDQHFADTPTLFKLAPLNPINGLLEVLQKPLLTFNLIGNEFLFPGSLFTLIALYLVFLSRKSHQNQPIRKILLILILQVVAIAMLDGEHSIGHTYYYLGCMPTLTLVITSIMSLSRKNMRPKTQKILYTVFCLLWIGHSLERTLQDTSNYFSFLSRKRLTTSECHRLADQNPNLPWNQGYPFRSDFQIFPELGLCFGERQNSLSSEYGFYHTDSSVPAECDIIDQTPRLKLVQCTGDKKISLKR